MNHRSAFNVAAMPLNPSHRASMPTHLRHHVTRDAWCRLGRSTISTRTQPLRRSLFHQRRWQSHLPSASRDRIAWSTGRVLLFTTFASSVTYLYGNTHTGLGLDTLRGKSSDPLYGTTKDLDKVRPLSTLHSRRVLIWNNLGYCENSRPLRG